MTVDVPGKGTVEFPDDTPHDQIEKAIKDWVGGDQETTSVTGAFLREAATGVAPGAAAAAAFGPSAELGAPFAPETYGLAPLATGLIGSLGAGLAAEYAQSKLLQRFFPGFLKKEEQGRQEHPLAAAAGRVASAAPSFELSPGAILRSPKALAAQLGAQLGITTAQTGLEQHRLPTGSELLESAAVAALYGHPRFSLPIPASLQKGVQAYAAQKRQVQESGRGEYPGTEAQRIPPETGGRHRPAPATGLGQETQVPLDIQRRWYSERLEDPALFDKGRVINGEMMVPVGGKRVSGVTDNIYTEEQAGAIAKTLSEQDPAGFPNARAEPATDERGKTVGHIVRWGEDVTGEGFLAAGRKFGYKESVLFGREETPQITGSDAGGWTIRFQGREEPGFATREEAEQAANQVIGGQREMPKPEPVASSPEEDELYERMEREALLELERLRLKPEAQETQPKPEDPNVPWAKGAFFKALGGNRVAFYRDAFRQWITQDLRGFSEDRIKKLIHSKVVEEATHNQVIGNATGEEMSQYGRNLTPFERDIEERIYGKRFGQDFFNLGHEAFARRLRQAMGMTRGMFAELALKENLQLRSLDLMARIVRRAREAVGEKRATANRELYDRVLDNIDYAKAVLSGTQGPAAQRRHDPRQEAPPMDRALEEKLIDNFERRTRLPPEAAAASRREQPEWLKEEMQRRGIRPDRMFNDIDLGNPSVVAAIKSDPTLSEQDKQSLLKTGSLPEKLTAAAVVGPDGTVHTGANHPEILDRLGIKGFEKPESRNTPDFGFATTHRSFVTREEAAPIAERSGQALKEFEPGEPVHSDEVAAPGTRTPISEGPAASRRKLVSDDPREKRINYLLLIGSKMGRQANEYFQEIGWEGFSRQFLSGQGHPIDLATQSGEALNEAERLKDEIIYDPKAPRELRAKYWEERTRLNTFAANKRRADVRFEFKEGHATQRQVEEADRDFDYYRRYQKLGFVPAEETHPMWKETYQRLIDHFKAQLEFEMNYVNNPPANQFTAEGKRWARDPEEVKQSIKDTQDQIAKYQKAIDTDTPIAWRPPTSFGPAASRRDREAQREREREQGQSEMFGPQVKGLGSQIPPTAPEQRVAPESTLPPVTPLEQGAAYIFSGFNPPLEARGPEVGPKVGEPTEPTFENFAKWARRNISERLENGPLFDVWLDAVNKSIESAPGAKLNEMVEKLDLKSRVYPWRRVPGGRDYTRVEIPDFQEIPRDPVTWGESLFPGAGDIIKAQLGTDTIERLKAEREGIIKRQKLRSKALSAIYQRVIEEGMPTITDLTPKDITTEDIAFDNRDTNFGAYRTITPDERSNPEILRQIFTDEARAKGQPVSHTKRLAVMLNQRSGEVALVSAYPHGRSGIVVVEPSGATGKRGKPNVPMRSAMNRGWEPIISVLRKEPVKDFYKGFKDIADYNRYLGTDAAQREATSTEDFIGTRPEDELSDVPPTTRWQDAPLSTREALDVHDWLNDPEEWSGTTGIRPEIEAATTKPGMREAMQRLVDLGENNKLKPRQWNAIVALRKMALEQYRRDRNEFANIMRDLRTSLRGATPEARRAQIERASQGGPTPEGSMVTALNRLYEYNQASESQADYLSHVMGEFARPTAEPKGPQPVQGAASKETGRELTMLERRPPTATNWQGPPVPNMGAPTEPEIPAMLPPESQEFVRKEAARRFPYKPSEEGPAASIREIRERGKKRFEEIEDYAKSAFSKLTKTPYSRAQTRHDINTAADGADRNVELYANEGANEIRFNSVKPGEKKGVDTPEAKKVRESIPAVRAAMQVAESEEWKRVIGLWPQVIKDWKPVQEEARRQHKAVPQIPKELQPVFNRPKPEDLKAEHFNPVIWNARLGIMAARKALQSPYMTTRMAGRRWFKAAQKLKDSALYAKRHFNDPEMRSAAESADTVFQQHLENMVARGLKVSGRDYYTPGRYEGEIWNDNKITFGDMRILGNQFRMPKSFKNYYEAIKEGPYIPLNIDIADLAQHSLAAGGRIMAKEAWADGLKKIQDPPTGKPVAVEPEWSRHVAPGKPKEPMSPEAFQAFMEETGKKVIGKKAVTDADINEVLRAAGISGSPGGWKVPKNHEDYELVYPTPRSKPIAVRRGYAKLVKSATAKSTIDEMPILPHALTASKMLKNGVLLILDTFHPGRIFQYAGALVGKTPWSLERPGFRRGLHAIMYSPDQLDDAVRVGAITQKSADWARAPVKIWDNNHAITMTRQELLRFGLRRGLNATQTSDTLYRNSIQRIPFIGDQWNRLLEPANKWIFDRITPGVISESFVANMERMNAKNPHLSLDKQVREVVRDMNIFYGNLGRNGIFRHPTARDLASIVLLAPLWQEGLIAKEMRTLSRLTGFSYLIGRRGLGASAYFGPLTRGIARGLGAYFVLTQMANLASRGKWTFQNPEEDHKLDAWIPIGGEQGIWLSPMSVFGEVTHDLVRLAESNPKTWDAITQFGRNKLGPIGRLGWILAEGKSPTGEQITTTGGVLGRAASELAPAPISLGTYAKAVAPGVFGPVRGSQVAQRGLSAFGIKTQLPTRAETDIRRLADKFVKDNNLAYEPLAFTPTDQASYSKLRGALRSGDEHGAAGILQELRKHRSDEQILKSMRLSSERPFAGSKANEIQFLYSLSNQQLDQFYKANMDRATEYQKFLEFYLKQPLR